MSTVSIEDAYAEACKALGESMVMQRLQGQEIARLTALDSIRAQVEGAPQDRQQPPAASADAPPAPQSASNGD